ncbi:hypothetical protein [Rhodococcus qingshengii]|uniref:hypothetical protein n=1 Tax=Rhodococcus TaxID=1827 RepID=UPI001BAEB25A|nr:hypothetical protein [Rhodococcus qingshengii]MBS3695252.1 hypothetical protein [Rhodococcus qingshengii]
MTQRSRSEEVLIAALTDEQKALLHRVLTIERAKLHLSAYDATDDILAAVKGIIP